MSALTHHGISLPSASRILKWNLKRYPNGIFFLLGAGRLALSSALPAQAIESEFLPIPFLSSHPFISGVDFEIDQKEG